MTKDQTAPAEMTDLDHWLEAQRINGGPHGFECVGREALARLWDAAAASHFPSGPVTVAMPPQLSPEMIKAIHDNEMTRVEDLEQWHTRLGWLICAYDVLVNGRRYG